MRYLQRFQVSLQTRSYPLIKQKAITLTCSLPSLPRTTRAELYLPGLPCWAALPLCLPSTAQPGTNSSWEWQERLSYSPPGNATSKYLNCVVQWKGNKTILRREKGHEKMLIAWAVISLAAQRATLGLCLPWLIWLTYPSLVWAWRWWRASVSVHEISYWRRAMKR